MDDLITRLAFLGLGLFIGWIGGMIHTTRRYARQAREAARETAEKLRNERGAIDLRLPLAIVVLLIVIASVIQTARVNGELAESQDARESAMRCTETYLGETVAALNARTELTGPTSQASRAQLRAELRFLEVVARYDQVPPARIDAALQTFLKRARHHLQLLGEGGKTRAEYPYPTVESYRACLYDQ